MRRPHAWYYKQCYFNFKQYQLFAPKCPTNAIAYDLRSINLCFNFGLRTRPIWLDWAIFEKFWWLFFAQVAQINIDFLGYFEKLLWLPFGLFNVKFGLLFILTSGHSSPGPGPRVPRLCKISPEFKSQHGMVHVVVAVELYFCLKKLKLNEKESRMDQI